MDKEQDERCGFSNFVMRKRGGGVKTRLERRMDERKSTRIRGPTHSLNENISASVGPTLKADISLSVGWFAINEVYVGLENIYILL